MAPPVRCHLCGGHLKPLPSAALLGQVTSDCRAWPVAPVLMACQSCGAVQKAITDDWRSQAEQIYAGYAMYGQAGGAEQLSFDQGAGAGMARSGRIATWLDQVGVLPTHGFLLDIGCGNGAFMRAFGARQPAWTMTGCELDDRNQLAVEAIPGVAKLHVGPLTALGQQFDLVVLVHALEHMVNPVAFLSTIRPVMGPGASLLIQVPDLIRSPFDLLIADHCTHFTSKTLVDVVTRAGFVVERLADDCVDKELTLLCRVLSESTDAGPAPFSACGLTAAQAHLAWLGDIAEQGQALSGRVAVFGSSIAATWLASLLGDRLECFVDEDPGRVERSHLGRPILRPDQTPLNLPVLVPLRPELARSVTARLSATGLAFVEPPATR